MAVIVTLHENENKEKDSLKTIKSTEDRRIISETRALNRLKQKNIYTEFSSPF